MRPLVLSVATLIALTPAAMAQVPSHLGQDRPMASTILQGGKPASGSQGATQGVDHLDSSAVDAEIRGRAEREQQRRDSDARRQAEDMERLGRTVDGTTLQDSSQRRSPRESFLRTPAGMPDRPDPALVQAGPQGRGGSGLARHDIPDEVDNTDLLNLMEQNRLREQATERADEEDRARRETLAEGAENIPANQDEASQLQEQRRDLRQANREHEAAARERARRLRQSERERQESLRQQRAAQREAERQAQQEQEEAERRQRQALRKAARDRAAASSSSGSDDKAGD